MSAVAARAHHLTPRGTGDAGGAVTGFVVAILVLAAVAVGAFFYFGGEADVDVKNPDVEVSSSETPS
jgi:hypothetical protein